MKTDQKPPGGRSIPERQHDLPDVPWGAGACICIPQNRTKQNDFKFRSISITLYQRLTTTPRHVVRFWRPCSSRGSESHVEKVCSANQSWLAPGMSTK